MSLKNNSKRKFTPLIVVGIIAVVLGVGSVITYFKVIKPAEDRLKGYDEAYVAANTSAEKLTHDPDVYGYVPNCISYGEVDGYNLDDAKDFKKYESKLLKKELGKEAGDLFLDANTGRAYVRAADGEPIIFTNSDGRAAEYAIDAIEEQKEIKALMEDDAFWETYDADNDGLSDKEEEAIGTDPNKASTADDMYTDGEKVELGLNPLEHYDSDEKLERVCKGVQLDIVSVDNKNAVVSEGDYVTWLMNSAGSEYDFPWLEGVDIYKEYSVSNFTGGLTINVKKVLKENQIDIKDISVQIIDYSPETRGSYEKSVTLPKVEVVEDNKIHVECDLAGDTWGKYMILVKKTSATENVTNVANEILGEDNWFNKTFDSVKTSVNGVVKTVKDVKNTVTGTLGTAGNNYVSECPDVIVDIKPGINMNRYGLPLWNVSSSKVTYILSSGNTKKDLEMIRAVQDHVAKVTFRQIEDPNSLTMGLTTKKKYLASKNNDDSVFFRENSFDPEVKNLEDAKEKYPSTYELEFLDDEYYQGGTLVFCTDAEFAAIKAYYERKNSKGSNWTREVDIAFFGFCADFGVYEFAYTHFWNSYSDLVDRGIITPATEGKEAEGKDDNSSEQSEADGKSQKEKEVEQNVVSKKSDGAANTEDAEGAEPTVRKFSEDDIFPFDNFSTKYTNGYCAGFSRITATVFNTGSYPKTKGEREVYAFWHPGKNGNIKEYYTDKDKAEFWAGIYGVKLDDIETETLTWDFSKYPNLKTLSDFGLNDTSFSGTDLSKTYDKHTVCTMLGDGTVINETVPGDWDSAKEFVNALYDAWATECEYCRDPYFRNAKIGAGYPYELIDLMIDELDKGKILSLAFLLTSKEEAAAHSVNIYGYEYLKDGTDWDIKFYVYDNNIEKISPNNYVLVKKVYQGDDSIYNPETFTFKYFNVWGQEMSASNIAEENKRKGDFYFTVTDETSVSLNSRCDDRAKTDKRWFTNVLAERAYDINQKK